MQQVDFLKRLEELYAENVGISRKKNSDYADSGDAFLNFRACEILGVPAELGILVRMSDKLVRAANLMKPGRVAQVDTEKIGDTLSDLSNYSMILRIFLEEKAKQTTV